MSLVQTSGKKQLINGAGGAGALTYNLPANTKAGNKAITTLVYFNGSIANEVVTGITVGGAASVIVARIIDISLNNTTDIWLAAGLTGSSNVVSISTPAGTTKYITASTEEWDSLQNSPVDVAASSSVATTTASPTLIAGSSTTTSKSLIYSGFLDTAGTNWLSVSTPSPYVKAWEETNGTIAQAGSYQFARFDGVFTPSFSFTCGAALTWVPILATFKEITTPYSVSSALPFDFINTNTPSIATPNLTVDKNSLMIVCVGRGFLSDFATAGVSDNIGNSAYIPLLPALNYTLFPTSGNRLYYAGNVNSQSNTTVVTTTKPSNSDEVTLAVVELRNVNTIISALSNEDLTSPNTSASVTVDGPAQLCSFWWGDDNNGELLPAVSSGWTLVRNTSSLASNHVQCAIAVRTVTTAGTYSIDWTPSTPQGARVYIVAAQQVNSISSPSVSPPWGDYYARSNRPKGPSFQPITLDSFRLTVTNTFQWGKAVTAYAAGAPNPIFFAGRN
jgi:hypothetical protein